MKKDLIFYVAQLLFIMGCAKEPSLTKKVGAPLDVPHDLKAVTTKVMSNPTVASRMGELGEYLRRIQEGGIANATSELGPLVDGYETDQIGTTLVDTGVTSEDVKKAEKKAQVVLDGHWSDIEEKVAIWEAATSGEAKFVAELEVIDKVTEVAKETADARTEVIHDTIQNGCRGLTFTTFEGSPLTWTNSNDILEASIPNSHFSKKYKKDIKGPPFTPGDVAEFRIGGGLGHTGMWFAHKHRAKTFIVHNQWPTGDIFPVSSAGPNAMVKVNDAGAIEVLIQDGELSVTATKAGIRQNAGFTGAKKISTISWPLPFIQASANIQDPLERLRAIAQGWTAFANREAGADSSQNKGFVGNVNIAFKPNLHPSYCVGTLSNGSTSRKGVIFLMDVGLYTE